MPVTTTPRSLLIAAYGKSTKNQPGRIASESTELLDVVTRVMRGMYSFGARVNPLYFGARADVVFASGWARPEKAELIFRIEDAAGNEVVVVPFDDRGAEAGQPAVYRFGQMYYPASAGEINPQGGSLTFFYSKRPDTPANLDATLDASWPEPFNELPILDIAAYLANKDGRQGELPMLTSERAKWVKLYAAFLEHETANERRRFGHVARFNVPSVVPIWSLFGDVPAEAGQ